MGNAKAEKEELKKLEDEAYFELCQIIAEAMQEQSIELLDFRITSWKNKYKLPAKKISHFPKKRSDFCLFFSGTTERPPLSCFPLNSSGRFCCPFPCCLLRIRPYAP